MRLVGPSPHHAGPQAEMTMIMLEDAADNAIAERSEGRPKVRWLYQAMADL